MYHTSSETSSDSLGRLGRGMGGPEQPPSAHEASPPASSSWTKRAYDRDRSSNNLASAERASDGISRATGPGRIRSARRVSIPRSASRSIFDTK